jgi:hypothetical protein
MNASFSATLLPSEMFMPQTGVQPWWDLEHKIKTDKHLAQLIALQNKTKSSYSAIFKEIREKLLCIKFNLEASWP